MLRIGKHTLVKSAARATVAARTIPLSLRVGYKMPKVSSSTQSTSYVAPYHQARQSFYKDLVAKPWGSVSQKYIKQFNDEEQDILQKTLALTHTTPQAWERFKVRQHAIFQQSQNENILKFANPHAKRDQHLEDTFAALAKKFHIDPSRLQLLYGHNMSAYMATAQTHIVINQQAIERMREVNQLYATFAHEFQHAMHDDFFNNFCKKNLLLYLNIDPALKLEIISKHLKLTEKRADILASLAGFEYLDSIAGFTLFNYLNAEETRIIVDNLTHPTIIEAMDNMETLLGEMQPFRTKK